MSDVYRWAVVDKDGEEVRMFGFCKTMDGLMRHVKFNGMEHLLRDGYRVAKFKLVECAEGEGEG